MALALVLPSPGLALEPGFDAVIGGTRVGTTLVIGDGVAVPDSWPSVVALVEAGSGSPADRQICGATVIAPRWIMTAAHCLHGARQALEASDLRVVADVTDLRAEPADERVVTNLFVHPGYDHAARDARDDIALIELANVVDAPAVSLFGGDTEALGSAPGIVVGWGATEFTDPYRATYPDALHHASVPLVSRATCNAPLSYDGYVSAGQLCAGYPEGGVDACVGDSGGPLFVDTGGRVEQVGIVSYGRDCAQPLFYGIYTNVSAYRGWIGEYVELEPSPAEGDTPSAEGDTPSAEGDTPSAGALGASGLLALLGGAAARRRRGGCRRAPGARR